MQFLDELYKRYSNPFPLIDGMIQTGRFAEWVNKFVDTINSEREEQTLWDYWLHKDWENSFADFKSELETDKANQNMSEQAMETTIQNSLDILKDFNPTGGES